MYEFGLNYEISVFNPLLKILIIFLYAYSFYAYTKGKKQYGGILQDIIGLLVIVAMVGALAALFRFAGGNFPTSFKWVESIGYVIQAGVFAYAAHKFIKAVE